MEETHQPVLPGQLRDANDSRRRRDPPGSLHHVTNRGVARRAIFETESEIRFFFSLVARAVHKRWWRVHAYTVLHTHFHLLVRVLDQSLSRTMRWILFRYARRFNRRRQREGPLFTSRFFSRPVRSQVYRRIVVSYIDNNPVAAGLVTRPSEYPHGSAQRFVRALGPPWLDRSMVEGLIQELLGRPPDSGDYGAVFGGGNRAAQDWIAERRIQSEPGIEDPIDDLLTAPTDRIRVWLVRRAILADGKDLRPPLVTPQAVDVAVTRTSRSDPGWEVPVEVRHQSGWQLLLVGLLHDIVKLSGPETAAATSLTVTQVYRRARQHRRLLEVNPEYAHRCAEVLGHALRGDHG